MIRIAQDNDTARTRFSQEDVTVRSDGQEARALEILSENTDAETVRYGRKKTIGSLDFARSVAGGFRGERRGQVGFLTMRELSGKEGWREQQGKQRS
jgi:hypothetical protein